MWKTIKKLAAWILGRTTMKFDKLISTKLDETGPFVPVEDWNDLTIQIASVDPATPFAGTVVIEGTTDADPATTRWSEVASQNASALVPLAGLSLFGVRARTTFMTGGDVLVTVTGK
jgi:hypothetical protein